MERGERVRDEAESLDKLLGRIQPRLQHLVRRHGIPAEDTDDLLQNALLACINKRHTIHDLESWLVGTVRKQCLMYVRSSRRRLYRSVDSAVLEFLAEPQRGEQERAEVACDLEGVLSRIPARCRSLLRLRYQLGYAPKEVARQLGYQPSSVGKVTSRCLAALTQQMISAGYAKGTKNV